MSAKLHNLGGLSKLLEDKDAVFRKLFPNCLSHLLEVLRPKRKCRDISKYNRHQLTRIYMRII